MLLQFVIISFLFSEYRAASKHFVIFTKNNLNIMFKIRNELKKQNLLQVIEVNIQKNALYGNRALQDTPI
jgi:hypothetical protein